VLLLSVSSPLFAQAGSLLLSVNGSLHARYSFEELSPYCYPILDDQLLDIINNTAVTDSYLFGITLDEMFPVFVDAWELTATNDGRSETLKDPNLAEQLSQIAVVIGQKDTDGSVTLYQNEIALNLTGEVSDDTFVEIWVSWEGVGELKEEIERFATMHGLTIKTLEVPKISSKLVQTQRGGGSVPDVVMVQSDYIDELVEANTIQALDYMDLDSFDKAGMDSFNLYGRQWAVPFYFDSQAIICNGDVFSLVGLDADDIETLKDFEDAAAAIRDYSVEHQISIVPLSWNLYSAYWLLPFQYGFGKTRLIEPDGMVIVSDKPTVDAMQYLLSLLERSLLSANERDAMLANFVSGKTAMMLSASYMIPELERLELSFDIVPFPINQTTGAKVAPILDYKGLAITKRSKNPILARRLVQYLTGIGVQQRFTAEMNKLPAATTAMTIDGFDSEIRKAVKRSAEGGECIPPDPAYGIYKNVLWSMLRLIIDGKFTAQEGMQEAQRLIDAQTKDFLNQLPEAYRTLYTIHEGEENNEKSDAETDGDAAADRSGGGFFNWLRNLW
jgi:ABC-type glycerol-3-phosphate transport system substrate-binding protein